MVKWTRDEKAIVFGVLMSACVAGVGILELIQAPLNATLPAFIWQMVVGGMLFNAGVSGLVGLLAIWFNYQATL